MARPEFRAVGVMPATLVAFNEDFSIDQAATRSHLRDVINTDGVTAVVVNGHASEVHACRFDEQKLIVEMAVDEAKGRMPVVGGIYTDGTLEAVRIAKMSEAAGCSALLVFPPNSMAFGGVNRFEMPISYFRAIANATDLPLIVFQYALNSPVGYSPALLEKLVEEIPSIVGIKDFCGDGQVHEHNIRTFQSLSKPISILTSHSSWLLGSMAMGPKGILSGSGSVMADLHVALFRAIQAGDLDAARAANDRIYPLARAFYQAPAVDMHNRMKEALVMLGRLPRAVVRPPLLKLDAQELSIVHQALVASRLLVG